MVWEIKSKNIQRAFDQAHVTEGAGVAADKGDANPGFKLTDILDAAIPYLTREIAPFYDVPKGQNNVIVPKMSKVTATELASGTFGLVGDGVLSYATITPDKDFGVNFQWDRQFAENVQWDVMAPFVKEAIRSTEDNLMGSLVTAMITSAGVKTTLIGTLTWDVVVQCATSLEVNDYHCDKVIASPALYADMLKQQQFVDASYMGSDTPIMSGILKTNLGIDFIRTSKCPSTVALFIDSSHAYAVAMARDGLVEEYQYPDTNKYGVVVSKRYGLGSLNANAINYVTV